MEDERLREKLHNQNVHELRFTKENRDEVFKKIHQPAKRSRQRKAFIPAAVSFLVIGICLFLFFPSLLSGNLTNEPDSSVASDPAIGEKEFSTTLITLKSGGMDDRIYVNLLLAYNENEKRMNFVSIPHDARVPVAQEEDGTAVYDKLLFSYQSGGAEEVQKNVSEWIGLQVDQHAVIDLETLSKLIASMDGVEYGLREDIRVRGISTAAIEFGEGTNHLNGEKLAALMMAATEGSELDERNLLNLLDVLMERLKNEIPSAQLGELFNEIETDVSPNFFLENLSEIETMNMIPLSEGMIPAVGPLNGVEGQHSITFEEEFLQTALKQLTEFDPERDGCTMQTKKTLFYAGTIALLLAGCGDGTAPDVSEDEAAVSETEQGEETAVEDEAATEETEEEGTEEAENTEAEESESALSPYSNEQIEYARVWLQLGANQEIDGLYVTKIPAGTPLNPDDETSAVYPEDVIQLAGSRLVDGSITYSGNGDGTINVYNVPQRWDGEYPAGEAFYQGLIDSTELVPVDMGADEDVVRLIELLKMQ